MFVRLSILMELLGSHGTDLNEIWSLSIFRKSVENIRLSWKSDKNIGYFTWRPMYIFDHISLSYSGMRDVSDKSCRENQNTHCMFSNLFFFFGNLAVYEITRKYIVQRGRPQMICRMHILCWIPTATNTHSQYVILIAFPLQQRLHESAVTLRYTYIAWLVFIKFVYGDVPYVTNSFCKTVKKQRQRSLDCELHLL
jgi:hypothetical protein